MVRFSRLVAHVDLTSGQVTYDHCSKEVVSRYLGGRALANHLLQNMAFNDVEQVPIVVLAGRLAATGLPFGLNGTCSSRSPYSGRICHVPLEGGFGAVLQRAGFLGLVIRGKSAKPVDITVRAGSVQIGPATKSGDERAVDGAGRQVAVGILGSAAKGHPLGCLFLDGQPFGAGGFGQRFFRAGLWAVRVFDDISAPVATAKEGMGAVLAPIFEQFQANPYLCGPLGISRTGTLALADLLQSRSALPVSNFRHTRLSGPLGSGFSLLAKKWVPIDDSGCGACPVKCHREDSHQRPMPGLAPLLAMTALVGNRDLEAGLDAVRVCGEFGIDALEVGAAVAAFVEIEGRSLTGGELVTLVGQVGRQEGVGALLASGARVVAQSLGRPKTAMVAGGQALPPIDPRGAVGMALSYTVAPQGAGLFHSFTAQMELLRKPVPVDRFLLAGKARLVKKMEDKKAAGDALGVCETSLPGLGLDDLARLATAATGEAYTTIQLGAVGAAAIGDELALNRRFGVVPSPQDLPERFFDEPGDEGRDFAVPPIDRGQFVEVWERYQLIRAGGDAP